MITVYSNVLRKNVKIHNVVNRGDRLWLLGIGCGFDTHMFLVEGDNESEVVDAFVDSKWGHWVKIDQDEVDKNEARLNELIEKHGEDEWEQEAEKDPELKAWLQVDRAGNFGDPICLDELRILERVHKVNYFAKRDSLDQ